MDRMAEGLRGTVRLAISSPMPMCSCSVAVKTGRSGCLCCIVKRKRFMCFIRMVSSGDRRSVSACTSLTLREFNGTYSSRAQPLCTPQEAPALHTLLIGTIPLHSEHPSLPLCATACRCAPFHAQIEPQRSAQGLGSLSIASGSQDDQ